MTQTDQIRHDPRASPAQPIRAWAVPAHKGLCLASSFEPKPHSIPAAPNSNEDPPPSPTPSKNLNPNPNSKSFKPPKPSRSSSTLPKSPTKSSKPPKSDVVMPDNASASPFCKSDRKRKASDFSDDDPATTSDDKGS